MISMHNKIQNFKTSEGVLTDTCNIVAMKTF